MKEAPDKDKGARLSVLILVTVLALAFLYPLTAKNEEYENVSVGSNANYYGHRFIQPGYAQYSLISVVITEASHGYYGTRIELNLTSKNFITYSYGNTSFHSSYNYSYVEYALEGFPFPALYVIPSPIYIMLQFGNFTSSVKEGTVLGLSREISSISLDDFPLYGMRIFAHLFYDKSTGLVVHSDYAAYDMNGTLRIAEGYDLEDTSMIGSRTNLNEFWVVCIPILVSFLISVPLSLWGGKSKETGRPPDLE